METLESSVIRHLILKAKLEGGQLFDIGRTVLNMAVKEGLLSVAPDLAYQNPLAEKITVVIWELIIEGLYTPGTGMQNPNLPYLRVTDYGRKCFEAGELTAHDPDDYLQKLKTVCTSIDDVTLLYTGESLDTFRKSNYLASTVMIGVAAESMLDRLVDAVHAALNTGQRKAKFEQDTKGKLAKRRHDEVLARLRTPASPLPTEIESVLTQHIDGIYDLIRRTRNDAGHPTGKRIGRDEAHALLLLFPTYCKTVHDLIVKGRLLCSSRNSSSSATPIRAASSGWRNRRLNAPASTVSFHAVGKTLADVKKFAAIHALV